MSSKFVTKQTVKLESSWISKYLDEKQYPILNNHGGNLREVTGGGSLPNFENMPLCRARMEVQCSSAGQHNGTRAIGELLLLKKKMPYTIHVCKAASDTPKNLVKLSLSATHL